MVTNYEVHFFSDVKLIREAMRQQNELLQQRNELLKQQNELLEELIDIIRLNKM